MEVRGKYLLEMLPEPARRLPLECGGTAAGRCSIYAGQVVGSHRLGPRAVGVDVCDRHVGVDAVEACDRRVGVDAVEVEGFRCRGCPLSCKPGSSLN